MEIDLPLFDNVYNPRSGLRLAASVPTAASMDGASDNDQWLVCILAAETVFKLTKAAASLL
ncbi:hypothetical protein N7537_008878 [Penicillium hordei]|jgi:hypothetical protein|uniref:Uncharacterized protein n=1 Tax=Penicillium hordei TaxID=40994 RepID=A0AAD6E180_9EURO|nr:uncharacterized protein N7537_008878 [Penicillium hordei]KAJ5598794.1 hypothetical protein N7537_008878 [Penicillium hordei]